MESTNYQVNQLSYFSSLNSFNRNQINNYSLNIPFHIPKSSLEKITLFITDFTCLENSDTSIPFGYFKDREWFDCFMVLDYLEPFYTSNSDIWNRLRFLTLFSRDNSIDLYNIIIFTIFRHQNKLYQTNTNDINLHKSPPIDEYINLINSYFYQNISMNQDLWHREFFLNHLFLLYRDTIINYNNYYKLINKPKLNIIDNLIKLSGHRWLPEISRLNNAESSIIISGGSLVYAYLNTIIPPSSDIDIWIVGINYRSNLQVWKSLLNLITKNCPGSIIKIRGSVTTIIPYNPSPPLQIIMTEYSSKDEVIKNFDLSYVCSYLDLSDFSLKMDLGCLFSWNTKSTIGNNIPLENIKSERIMKAQLKGFTLGIYPNISPSVEIDKKLNSYPRIYPGHNNLSEVIDFYNDKDSNYFSSVGNLFKSEIYPSPFKCMIEYTFDSGCHFIDNPHSSKNIIMYDEMFYELIPINLEEDYSTYIFNHPKYLTSPKLSFCSLDNYYLSVKLSESNYYREGVNYLLLPSKTQINNFKDLLKITYLNLKKNIEELLKIPIINIDENHIFNYLDYFNQLTLKVLSNAYFTNEKNERIDFEIINKLSTCNNFIEMTVVFHHFSIIKTHYGYMLHLEPKIIGGRFYIYN